METPAWYKFLFNFMFRTAMESRHIDGIYNGTRNSHVEKVRCVYQG